MRRCILGVLACALLLTLNPARAIGSPHDGEGAQGYVARQDGLRAFFDAIAARLDKPVIVSRQAARKSVSGEFALDNPQAVLERVASQLGLIWYDDGQAIYIYDANEMRSAAVPLRAGSIRKLKEFLRTSGLYDRRFPLRGDGSGGMFYVSGPPVFVDLVIDVARFIGGEDAELDPEKQKVSVIRLHNTFVDDRTYDLRDQKIQIPGIASVIERLLRNEKREIEPVLAGMADNVTKAARASVLPPLPAPLSPGPGGQESRDSLDGRLPEVPLPQVAGRNADDGDIRLVAYPNTNSLLIKGSPRQVRLVEGLVHTLDEARRHVELSLWIVDISKDDLDQLGVNWQGSVKMGDRFGLTFNQSDSVSTLDGGRFIASILALSQQNRANVVSRPVVLTQENVPAIFDHSKTFYTKLIGERAVDLQQVTYGTLVSVLPRFSAHSEIEMSLTIEDGNAMPHSGADVNGMLPEVGRTRISTVARVPKGKSLLIGGYTRDESGDSVAKIPLLGDLPWIGGAFRYRKQRGANLVRVFLISPRQIETPFEPDASDLAAQVTGGIERAGLQGQVRRYLDGKHGN
ncbi:type III secretion system outer membrane pore InvG [Burkholderia ubonensis]|nr:type III secretion system outer membrane pore InvG [Burkholderia ubonensis]